MGKPLLVILESPDGLGKTTQSKILSEKYQAKLIIQPSAENSLGFLRNEVKNNPLYNPSFRQALHTMSHIVDAFNYLDGSCNVVMDRSFISTYVYGQVTHLEEFENDILLRVHQEVYRSFASKYKTIYVFLDANGKYKEGNTDQFEGTFNWGHLRDAYVSFFAGVANSGNPLLTEDEVIISVNVHSKSIKEVSTEIDFLISRHMKDSHAT
jgi:hypothetical protein